MLTNQDNRVILYTTKGSGRTAGVRKGQKMETKQSVKEARAMYFKGVANSVANDFAGYEGYFLYNDRPKEKTCLSYKDLANFLFFNLKQRIMWPDELLNSDGAREAVIEKYNIMNPEIDWLKASGQASQEDFEKRPRLILNRLWIIAATKVLESVYEKEGWDRDTKVDLSDPSCFEAVLKELNAVAETGILPRRKD